MRELVLVGHTNEHKYFQNGHFVLHKTRNGFNHLLDYHVLRELPFVPPLIADTPSRQVWARIDGAMLDTPTPADLVNLATIMRTLHKSSVALPPNNLRRRLDFYIKALHAKGLRPVVVDQFYREMRLTLSKMGHRNPCHNDIWAQNILRTPAGALFLVDWEYATMGDKHFDLAFYITAAQLSPAQEQVLLAAYDAVDGLPSHDPQILARHKRLAFYITICWAYAQKVMPFDITWVEQALLKS